MKFKSLLTHKFGSDAVDPVWGQIIMTFVFSLLIMILIIWKFTSMQLTDFELFFGILLAVAMTLQCISYGLLLPLSERTNSSRFNTSPGQIIIFATSIIVLIIGVWSLRPIVQTEYQVIIGILLLLDVMMSGCFIGVILPLVQANRARKFEERQTQPTITVV